MRLFREEFVKKMEKIKLYAGTSGYILVLSYLQKDSTS